VVFLLDTGCRVRGLRGLAVKALDVEKPKAELREKGEEVRLVLFKDRNAEVLGTWLGSILSGDTELDSKSLVQSVARNTNSVSQVVRCLEKRSGVWDMRSLIGVRDVVDLFREEGAGA
jgi:site-specific recombinase XerC